MQGAWKETEVSPACQGELLQSCRFFSNSDKRIDSGRTELHTQTKSYQYHQLSKHTLQSLYSSNHRLNWNTQPDPFRVYHGCEKLILSRKIQTREIGIFALIKEMLLLQRLQGERHSRIKLNAGTEQDLVLEQDDYSKQNDAPRKEKLTEADPAREQDAMTFISSLLFFSMAISAWKQIRGTDERWALRVNPSSGNLHPTETHILVQGLDGIEDGAYHYRVDEHVLERRASGKVIDEIWKVISSDNKPPPPVMICLTSIFWREAWKYRDRAFRYCQLDLGHAAAAISLSSASFGWTTEIIAEFPDLAIVDFLELSNTDEKPMIFLPLYPISVTGEAGASEPREQASTRDSAADAKLQFLGQPNRISSSEIVYKSINEVYQAGILTEEEILSQKNLRQMLDNKGFAVRSMVEEASGSEIEAINLAAVSYQPPDNIPAHTIVRTRRSAVEMDGALRISLARLSRILIDSSRGFGSTYGRALAFDSCKPDVNEVRFFIHIILYVHRVDGIAPGVYYFNRQTLDLTCMNETNVQVFAKFSSCMQDIASDGVFSVSLVADMQSAMECFGERAYRYVHQEAGFIGHMFYLTAHALKIDATGIGCFIDDEINQSLPPGMEVVYNFTFGRALEDERLTTLPAYDFEDPSKPFWNKLR